MHKLFKLFALLMVAGLCNPVFGQTYSVEINVNMSAPYPTNYDAYMDHLSKGLVTLNNTTLNAIDVYLKIRFTEKSGRVSVTSPLDITNAITLNPGVNILTQANIEDIFSSVSDKDFYTNGLDDKQRRAMIVNKQLPEGSYTLCVYAYDINQKLLSDPNLNGCADFDIYFAERPMIMQPDDEEKVPALGSFTIMWSHFLTNVDARERTGYILKIIDITEANITNVANAFLNPGISADYEEDFGPSVFVTTILDGPDFPLIKDHQYAVRVTAYDPEDQISYQSGGHSKIVVFTYGDGDDAAIAAPVLDAPSGKDGLYSGADIEIKWSHEDVDSTKFSYRLIVVDRTATKTVKNLSPDSIKADKFPFVLNRSITAHDTTIEVDDKKWIQDHLYSFIILATSKDKSVEIENEGISDFAAVKYGLKKAPPASVCDPSMTAATPIDVKAVTLKKSLYQYGKVKLKVDSILSGDLEFGYKGEGNIKVNLTTSKSVFVKVTFTDLKVNKKNEVFEGNAIAVVDGTSTYEEKIANMVAGVGVLSKNDFSYITSSSRFGAKLIQIQRGKPISLPFGIDKNYGSDTISINIAAMKFTPNLASFSAIFLMENKSWGEHIPTFGATNVCFDSNGVGKDVTLFLGADYKIPGTGGDLVLKASENDGKGKTGGTFVKFSNAGFQSGQISAEIAIPQKVLVAETDGEPDLSKKAEVYLSGTFTDPKNFILEASMKPCQIPGLSGFSFELVKGYYDQSETLNPAEMMFPENYPKDTADKTWKGIWFASATVSFPKEWGFAGEGKRMSGGITNFIKDDIGVSLKGGIKNVVGPDVGEFEGFAFSVDDLSINILRNQFMGVSMTGRLGLPIIPGQYLNYTAHANQPKSKEKTNTGKVKPLDLAFVVKPDPNGYNLDYIKTKIVFDQSSYFVLKNDSAVKGLDILLSGVVSLSAGDVQMPGVRFDSMQIAKMTYKDAKGNPIIDPANPKGKWVFKGPRHAGQKAAGTDGAGTSSSGSSKTEKTSTGKVKGFSFKLNEFKMAMEPGGGDSNYLNVIVDAVMMLTKETKKGKQGESISGGGKFTIKSLVTGVKPRDVKMTYAGFDINKLSVGGSVSGISLKGEVEFYKVAENETSQELIAFGNGFRGELNIKTQGIVVDLEARFGNNDKYEYWYVFGDVAAGNKKASEIKTTDGFPQPFFTSGMFSIYGVHGGAYYHMIDKGSEFKTPSTRYTPTADNVMGFKAGLTFSIGQPNAMWAKADLGFEVKNGLLSKVRLEGDGYILKKNMTSNPIVGENGDSVQGLQATLEATLNFKEKTEDNKEMYFDADLNVYARVAEGLIVGTANTHNKVVKAKLVINKDNWWLWVGTPQIPGKVSVVLPLVGSRPATAYFMMGNKSLPDAVVPKLISDVLGEAVNNTDKFKSENAVGDESELTKSNRTGNNGGFAMGADIGYVLDINAGILYAKFEAAFGFDLSLVNKEGTVCKNNNNLPMGMDGWYAKGQLYAGFRGDMGIRVDIFFYKGDISLATISAAMLIEGGLPNPTWVYGRASMRYEVLGGLVSGSTGFTVKLGNRCEEYVADPLAGIDFIANMSPEGNDPKISVFASELVSFNSKVVTKSSLYSNNADDIYYVKLPNSKETRKFKIVVDDFKLYKGSNESALVTGTQELRSNTELIFRHQMLDSHSKYTYTVVLKAYEYDGKNWNVYMKDKKTAWTASKTATFTTGGMPNYVPLENVKFTYPFLGEKTYLIKENIFNAGFVQLINSQGTLFEPITPSDQQWHSHVVVKWYTAQKYSKNNTDEVNSKWLIYTDTTFKVVGKFLKFRVPNNLDLGTRYIMVIVRDFYRNEQFSTEGKQMSSVKSTRGTNTINREGKTYNNYESSKPKMVTLFANIFTTSTWSSLQEKAEHENPKPGNKLLHSPARFIREGSQVTDLLHAGITYWRSSQEDFSWSDFDSRNIGASNTKLPPVIELKEDYSADFYQKVFKYYLHEALIWNYLDSLARFKGIEVQRSWYDKDFDIGNWNASYKIQSNAENDYRLTRLRSELLKYAELSAPDIWKYGRIMDGITGDNKWVPKNSLNYNWKVLFYTANGTFKVSPIDGKKYTLSMRYMYPWVDESGQLYVSPLKWIDVQFKYTQFKQYR